MPAMQQAVSNAQAQPGQPQFNPNKSLGWPGQPGQPQTQVMGSMPQMLQQAFAQPQGAAPLQAPQQWQPQQAQVQAQPQAAPQQPTFQPPAQQQGGQKMSYEDWKAKGRPDVPHEG